MSVFFISSNLMWFDKVGVMRKVFNWRNRRREEKNAKSDATLGGTESSYQKATKTVAMDILLSNSRIIDSLPENIRVTP
ncbi:hypothetical protein GK047_00525 [Paenibacillus sp. SYP-B3998]|uniref:Uncharacterized protein n=1 Tax=Paenibacillus sp. SYP-B3998 TaxID=2678564 RepID=A0A6G3ZR47_9BACL|nr:hypothetical protein [Paenibacillus sp. SYP-B3998]NEW04508.1 hypothetical protein [Paenibacillus sp. SYP-B3998]